MTVPYSVSAEFPIKEVSHLWRMVPEPRMVMTWLGGCFKDNKCTKSKGRPAEVIFFTSVYKPILGKLGSRCLWMKLLLTIWFLNCFPIIHI